MQKSNKHFYQIIQLFNNDVFFRKAIKLSNEDYEKRLNSIERLSRPRKLHTLEFAVDVIQEKRPVNMEAIERLSIPRKIKSPHLTDTFTSRPLQSSEYYEKLSQPRKYYDDANSKVAEPTLTSLQRTIEMAVPLARHQRRKFMKGDNEKFKFTVSRAALQYKASTKINKLAVPKQIPDDPNQHATKSKRKK